MVVPRAACLAALIAAASAFDTLPGQELTTEEAMRLVGDRKAWRAIFSDNYPELVADGFAWPEGPTWLEEEKALRSFVARGVDAEMIAEIDGDGDGTVDRYE